MAVRISASVLAWRTDTDTQVPEPKLKCESTEDVSGIFSIETKHGVTIMIKFVANMVLQKTGIALSSQRLIETV